MGNQMYVQRRMYMRFYNVEGDCRRAHTFICDEMEIVPKKKAIRNAVFSPALRSATHHCRPLHVNVDRYTP